MIGPAGRQAGATRDAQSAAFDLLLTSGGDERIWPDPVTRRNRYGAPATPSPDEIWFSSSTATAISPRAYKAARLAFDRLTTSKSGARVDPGSWLDDIRERINRSFGFEGCAVALSASGTEAEFLSLTLAKAILCRPLTNIVVAPDETGSGVMLAAQGAHFSNTAAFGVDVFKGRTLEGWESGSVSTIGVPIRDEAGRLRDPADVDHEIGARVETALKNGADILLHVLDASKTGRSGPSRQAARAIKEAAGDRALVVVDACQLRCSPETIRADLRSGFMVMITGSKFIAGPAFCGALLIPPQVLEKLRDLRAPPGLSSYSARFDWPCSLRSALVHDDFPPINLGLAARWEAALFEIEFFLGIPSSLKRDVLHLFGDAVRAQVAARSVLSFLDPSLAIAGDDTPSIFPILTDDGDAQRARRIYVALRAQSEGSAHSQESEIMGTACHVGQPVTIGNGAALRICASAPLISGVCARLAQGMDLRLAFAPVRSDLARVFRKWDLARERLRRSSEQVSVARHNRARA
jgi:hypothetical protein